MQHGQENILKMGRWSKQTFFQRRHADVQQTHEKMLSITISWENTSQNYMRYHLASARVVIKKKKKKRRKKERKKKKKNK